MHLIRRLKSSFKFVPGNRRLIGLPVLTIHYYVALGNMGDFGRGVWRTRLYHFICCRLLCLRTVCRSTQCLLTRHGYYALSMSIFSGFVYKGTTYPVGTHIT